MKKLISALAAASLTLGMSAADVTMTLRADKPGAQIQPTMYGLFFEDINYAADGGLYAEMVKNRSFEFTPDHLGGWTASGKVALLDDGPFDRNPHYVRLSDPGHREKRTCISNEGFFGMHFDGGKEYRFSVWARPADGRKSRIKVVLADPAAGGETQELSATEIDIDNNGWHKYTATLKPGWSAENARLRVFLASPDGVDLEH
ncbi:MAG: carbohydrate binding domain-containing protein, partial [Muribaculaceae bacterium]|nr:carbohydrate binding domain-containing protein [Muribaculaceae bacterium]